MIATGGRIPPPPRLLQAWTPMLASRCAPASAGPTSPARAPSSRWRQRSSRGRSSARASPRCRPPKLCPWRPWRPWRRMRRRRPHPRRPPAPRRRPARRAMHADGRHPVGGGAPAKARMRRPVFGRVVRAERVAPRALHRVAHPSRRARPSRHARPPGRAPLRRQRPTTPDDQTPRRPSSVRAAVQRPSSGRDEAVYVPHRIHGARRDRRGYSTATRPATEGAELVAPQQAEKGLP